LRDEFFDSSLVLFSPLDETPNERGKLLFLVFVELARIFDEDRLDGFEFAMHLKNFNSNRISII
jgi:hypothetical protein